MKPPSAAQPSPEAQRYFTAARHAYEADKALESYRLIEPVLKSERRFAEAHHLAGLCQINLGDFDAAERHLKAALGLDRRNLPLHLHLGDLLARPTRFEEAERLYRSALRLDPRDATAVASLVRLLVILSRYEEALEFTTPLASEAGATAAVLDLHAHALKHLGRVEEALEINARAQAAGSLGAQLEEPSILRERGRYVEAEAAARKIFTTQGDAPGAFVVLGQSLQDLGRHDEAELAFRDALRLAPWDDVAHEHLASLALGIAPDDARAMDPLDEALKAYTSPALIALKGRLLTKLKRFDEAYAVLAAGAAEAPKSAALHAAAAKAATLLFGQDPAAETAAMTHAETAFALAFDVPKVAGLMGEVYLATGMPERAAAMAEPLTRRWPANQALIALLAMAWRMTGDRRYSDLCDYDQVVQARVIDTPRGWPTLSAYLSDLSTALQEIHDVPLDAFGMVRRDGVESMTNLNADRGEVIRAFYDALDAPAQAYVSQIGRSRDALRRRNTGGARVMAGWTVKTRSSQFHGAHLHPEGWLSSAFYVELPAAVEQDRQGWIKFGEPAIPTRPKLAAEHWVKPEPGLFVLFPSYMWHGTEPFHGQGDRLVMSVDFLPSPR